MEKDINYAILISSQIQEMFEEDSDNHIDPDEFLDGENFKKFLHALSTMVPTGLYNNITGDSKNNLEYNHIANILCFEYSKHPVEVDQK